MNSDRTYFHCNECDRMHPIRTEKDKNNCPYCPSKKGNIISSEYYEKILEANREWAKRNPKNRS